MADQAEKVLAWKVEFENGAVELHPAEDFVGEPPFGRWITPLVAGGPTVDQAPDPIASTHEEA